MLVVVLRMHTQWTGWLRRAVGAGWLLALFASAGCAGNGPVDAPGVGYYWQSVNGHWALMNAARPVDDWLADPAVNPALKARLELAQRMRRFAVTDLALPSLLGASSVSRFSTPSCRSRVLCPTHKSAAPCVHCRARKSPSRWQMP